MKTNQNTIVIKQVKPMMKSYFKQGNLNSKVHILTEFNQTQIVTENLRNIRIFLPYLQKIY